MSHRLFIRQFAILPLLLFIGLSVELTAQTLHPRGQDMATADAATALGSAELLTIEQQADRSDGTAMISVDGGRSWRLVSADDARQVRNDADHGRLALARGTVASTAARGAISPNPSAGITTVHFELPSDATALLRVHSIGGRQVLEQPLSVVSSGAQVASFDAAALADGAYMVAVEQGGKIVYARTLVVAH